MKIYSKFNVKSIICLVILIQFFQNTGYSSCIFGKDISAQELDIGNMISWTTIQEVQNEYFIIEKSVDGINYEEIRQIEAAGNSEVSNDYRFLDVSTGEMQCYYRLKQQDFDKSQSYSSTVIVNRQHANNLVITGMSSTMTDGIFSLTLRSESAGSCNYDITDQLGKAAQSSNVKLVKGENILSFELTEIKNGIYQLALSMNAEKETIVVEKVAPNQMPRIDYVVREQNTKH